MNDSTSSAKALEQQVWQLMKAGRTEDAAAACDQLNQAFPEYATGWNTASRVAIGLNEPALAIQAAKHALLLEPGKPEFLLQMMASLAVYGDLDAANVIADQLATHPFETAYHAATCGVTMKRLQRYPDAEFHYVRAVGLNPNNPNYRIKLATVQRFMGKLEAASDNLDKAIALNPTDCEALLLRSGFRTYTEADNHVEELRATFDKISDGHPGRVQLHFALANELDDLQRFDESFQELQAGNAERRANLNYDVRREVDAIRATREHFTQDAFHSASPGFVNAEAIFIIGMPRSGTALVERVLNNHPVVKSMGELHNFGLELANSCEAVLGSVPADIPQLMKTAREIDYAKLGEAYINATRPGAGAHAHFIDRLGTNFLYAGLIHLALPKAKIINTVRGPMDNCYAAYRTWFPAGYPYSFDLEELASYYVAYSELMEYWQTIMPGVIHTVRYEDLVADSPAAIESLLEYCDLSFNQKSLQSFLRTNDSGNVSGVRVQHEIRANSIGHWKNYRKQLQPVAKILDAAGIDWRPDHDSNMGPPD